MMLDRCQYGRTGISPGKAMCEARQVQGSIFCGPWSEALERAASAVAKRMHQRWSPPRRGMRG